MSSLVLLSFRTIPRGDTFRVTFCSFFPLAFAFGRKRGKGSPRLLTLAHPEGCEQALGCTLVSLVLLPGLWGLLWPSSGETLAVLLLDKGATSMATGAVLGAGWAWPTWAPRLCCQTPPQGPSTPCTKLRTLIKTRILRATFSYSLAWCFQPAAHTQLAAQLPSKRNIPGWNPQPHSLGTSKPCPERSCPSEAAPAPGLYPRAAFPVDQSRREGLCQQLPFHGAIPSFPGPAQHVPGEDPALPTPLSFTRPNGSAGALPHSLLQGLKEALILPGAC